MLSRARVPSCGGHSRVTSTLMPGTTRLVGIGFAGETASFQVVPRLREPAHRIRRYTAHPICTVQRLGQPQHINPSSAGRLSVRWSSRSHFAATRQVPGHRPRNLGVMYPALLPDLIDNSRTQSFQENSTPHRRGSPTLRISKRAPTSDVEVRYTSFVMFFPNTEIE